jgi:membrane fusion protein (multidrug efflux system)
LERQVQEGLWERVLLECEDLWKAPSENSTLSLFLAEEGAPLMPASPVPVESAAQATKPEAGGKEQSVAPEPGSRWQKYVTPVLVILLALAVFVALIRNWNSWEGGKAEQITDDAYVRGDLTPLSTKVTGIVSAVHVADYQQVKKGDLLLELQDSDYEAQVAQAIAGVAAAKAAIENNRRQKQLQQAKIDRALAGVSQAQAEISVAQAGIAAAQADLDSALPERHRQEALIQTNSTTPQKVEQVVAAEEGARAQLSSRQASLEQARALLSSSQSAVEAERRGLDVMNSEDAGLIASLRGSEAALAVAKVDLGYTRIYSPGDGTVGARQVRPGQLVSPGTQVISFVDKTKWVEANYRETQLTYVRVGDPADIRIDEYPGQTIHGKVVEIAPASGSQFALLPPDNATGNFTKVIQRVPVKIALDDPELATKLRPGLSATATVRTRR